jgi:hypothetical protein
LAKREFCVYTSQTTQTFSSFTVISLVDAKEGSFPFRSRFEKVLKFCPLAEKRGSLVGVRERGFNSADWQTLISGTTLRVRTSLFYEFYFLYFNKKP